MVSAPGWVIRAVIMGEARRKKESHWSWLDRFLFQSVPDSSGCVLWVACSVDLPEGPMDTQEGMGLGGIVG